MQCFIGHESFNVSFKGLNLNNFHQGVHGLLNLFQLIVRHIILKYWTDERCEESVVNIP